MRSIRRRFPISALGASRAIAALLALSLLAATQNLHAPRAYAAADANHAVSAHADQSGPGHAHMSGMIAATLAPSADECADPICAFCLALANEPDVDSAPAEPVHPPRLAVTSHSAPAERLYRPPIRLT